MLSWRFKKNKAKHSYVFLCVCVHMCMYMQVVYVSICAKVLGGQRTICGADSLWLCVSSGHQVRSAGSHREACRQSCAKFWCSFFPSTFSYHCCAFWSLGVCCGPPKCNCWSLKDALPAAIPRPPIVLPHSSFPWVLFVPLLVCEGGERKTESLELVKVVVQEGHSNQIWQKPSSLLTDSQTEGYLSA